MKKTVVLLLLLAVLSFTLCGCKSGKKFDSAEAMITSMEGTYSASDNHSGEYIVINKENVIKFNINDVFYPYIDEKFFNDNFFDEDWEAFNIDVLLNKPYTKISTKAISADVKNSTLSGFWIDKDGTLYSQKKNGYSFEKISPESNYPTDEMKEKFETYNRSLQEYEISSIIKEADDKCLENKKSLDSKLASATKTSSSTKKCTASAKVIGECAFDSLKGFLKYPASAELLKWSAEPEKDSYGRVVTLIRCRYQNGFGNYVTQDVYVVLQSCSDSGEYTYMRGGVHYYIDKGSGSEIGYKRMALGNGFGEDPNYDSGKDPKYLEAIELAKNGDYESAINKLEAIKGYRSADSVISACEIYIRSQEYKKAVDLFADKKYTEAAEKMASLISVDKDGNEVAFLKSKRVIYLCGYLSNADTENNSDSSTSNDSQNNSDNESNGIDSSSNSTDENNSVSSNNVENSTENNNSDDNSFNSDNSGADSSNGNNNADANSSGSGNNVGNNGGNNGGDKTSAVHTHSYTDATCTEPKTCTVCGATTGSALGHSWEAVESTVHHDQEGHYEMVIVEYGYSWLRCPVCYEEFKSSDSYYSHFDSSHSNVSPLREQYTTGVVNDQYEETWVVDKEAYDEIVITGYKCGRCGATKQ